MGAAIPLMPDIRAAGEGTLFVLRKAPPAILTLRSDGSGLRTVLDGFEGEPDGVQVDSVSGTMFWTNMGVDVTAADGAIYRADLDGGNVELLVGHGAVVTPKQLQHDPSGGHIYWCDREGMRVMRANEDGGDMTVLVRRGSHPEDAADERRHCVGITIDVANRIIYWTQKGPKNGGQGAIYRAGLDLPPGIDADSRGDIETLQTGLPEPIDLAIDPGNAMLYWTDRGDAPDGNTLNRARIGPDGLSGREVIARGLAEGIGVALDLPGQRAFVTDLGGTVHVCSLQPGSVFTAIARPGPMTGIAFVSDVAPTP